MAKEIVVHFDITHGIHRKPDLQSFIHALSSFDHGRWKPDRYNNFEPIKRPFDEDKTDEVIDLWTAGGIGMLFKRVHNPKFDIDFTGERPNLLVQNQFNMFIDTGSLHSPGSADGILALLSCLYDELRPAYGYVSHYNDLLAKNRVVFKQGPATVERWVGRELKTCLPGCYWANWFGPPYVDFFGADRLREAPCFRRKETADGGCLIITAKSPLDYANQNAKNAERALAEHLNRDAFFDITNQDRPTVSPWPRSRVM